MHACSSLTALLTTAAVLSESADIGGWIQVNSDTAWGGRFDHKAVALPDGSIVLMGGWNGSSRFNDVWQSTDQGVSWTEMTSSAGWSARRGHAAVALPDGSIVLMGGYDGYRVNDVWRSTDQGASWTEMTSSADWSARDDHAAVVLPDGSIILLGGYDGSRINDVWRSTDQGASWTQMTGSAAWRARSTHAAVALLDGSIVLMGGYDRPYTDDVWRSTDQGASWTQMTSSAAWSARGHLPAVVLLDGSIVLMGGYDRPYTDDVWRSTNQGASWTQMTSSAAWTARSGHAAVTLPDGSIVLMGGYDASRLNDVWRTVCQAGLSRERATGMCEPCPASKYSSGGLQSEGCIPCPDGTYGVEPGQGTCPLCPFPHRCEANNACTKGASGPRCLQCVPGYFAHSDQCVECSDASLVPLVVALLALVVLGALSYAGVFTASTVAFLLLFVCATQLMSLYLSFSLRWPAFVAHFVHFFRPMAADVGVASLTCFAGLSYFTSLWCILGAYTLTLALCWYRALWASRARSSLDTTRKHRICRALVLMVVVSYVPLVRLLARALSCASVGSKYVLVADPEVQCWSGWHLAHAVLAIVLLFVLGIVAPCVLGRLVKHAEGHGPSLLLRPVTDLLCEDRLPWFGAALLLRLAAVAVLSVLGERTPVVQPALSALLSVATLVAVWRWRPWKPVPLVLGRLRVNDGLNHLHTWSEGTQPFVLGLGVFVAVLPASERVGFAAVACAACIAGSAQLVVAAVIMELARRRGSRGGLSKQADPRAVALELVERGDYDEARAMGNDLGDDRLQSLVRVEIELREASERVGGGVRARRAYQRLATRKLDLMQQLGLGPAEDQEDERLQGADASVETLESRVRSEANSFGGKWEALLAARAPARQASGTAAIHAVDAAATSLIEEHGGARRALQQRRDAVAFSLGAIEACELDHAISALDDMVAAQCSQCKAASTRLRDALEEEWKPLRRCDMADPSDLERAIARIRAVTILSRDGFAALERLLEHLHAQGDRHAATRLHSFQRDTGWLKSYLPALESPGEDVTTAATRRVRTLAADLRDRATQLSAAVERAKAEGDWEEGLRLVGEAERFREQTQWPVASECAKACAEMKLDLAVAMMRLARQRSWDQGPAVGGGSAGPELKQLQSEWEEVHSKTRQLTEEAMRLTQSRDVSDLQRAQDLFAKVEESCRRFAEAHRSVPRRLAQRGAFQAAKDAQELLNGAHAEAECSGGGAVEPERPNPATVV